MIYSEQSLIFTHLLRLPSSWIWPQFIPASVIWMDELALAVDMTARNLQDKVRKAGLPWSAAKGFDTFTPIGYYRLLLSCFTPDVILLM